VLFQYRFHENNATDVRKAESITNYGVNLFTDAYGMDDPNDIIGYIGHNQMIKIFESGRYLVVSSPDTAVSQYNPNTSDVSNLDHNNTFEDDAPVKYRAEFDVLNPSKVKSINVYLDCNYYNKYGIETDISEIQLQKLGTNGTTIVPIQTFTGSNIKKEVVGAKNRYYITIDATKIDSTPNRYFIEYSGNMHIKPAVETSDESTNEVQIEVITPTNNYGDSVDEKSPNRKVQIDMRVTRQPLEYR
jgi:hypothetical protein